MNGNSQNYFSGGWNNMPPTDFSQGQIPHSSGPPAFADNWHTPHQMAAYYAHNQHLPHQAPAHYADNRHIPPQVPAHYVDNMNLPHQAQTHHVDNSHLSYKTPTDNMHLPHPMPAHYADNRHLPHPTLAQYADNRHLPHPIPTHYADNKHLPHPTPTHYAQNTHLPPQTPAQYAQNTHLPPQTPTQYAQNTHLPPQTPAQYAQNTHLPPQTPTQYAQNTHLPPQTPAQYAQNTQLPPQTPTQYAQNTHLPPQTPAQYAQNTHLPPQTPAPYADKSHLPHPIPTHYADNKHLPHPTPTHYAQNMHLPPQILAHYADKSHLPHQTVEHCTDNKHLQHQTQVRYEDKMCLPHPNPEDYVDNKCLPHQTPDHYADKRKLSQQKSEACANKRQLSQQMSEACADKRQLPDQTSEQYADKNLSQQTPKDCADKKCLPQQTPEDCANKKCLPPLLQCEICELILDPKSMESHIKGMRHQFRVLQLHKQSTKHKTSCGEEIRHDQSSQISKEAYAANKCLSQQTQDHYADKRLLSQQTSEACADKRQLSQQTSEACADKRQLPDQTSEQYADKNLSQQTPKDCADKKCLPQQTPEDCANKKCLPQQTPEDCANKKCLPSLLQCEICDLKLDPKSMGSHYTGKRHRKRILELRGPSKKCLPANMHCEICDVQFGPKNLKSHNKGYKHKQRLLELREKSKKHKDSNGEEISHIRSSQINPVVQPKKVPTDVSKRKLRDHTGAKDRDFKVENVKNETSSLKKKNVPAEMSKRKVRDNTDAKDHGFKHEIEGATGGKYMKMNNGIRRSVKNDQPQSTPVELKASAGSNIAEKEYITCDFAATVIPQGPVASHAFTPPPAVENHIDLPREVTDTQEHHKVQKRGVETNDEPQSISMELQAPGGCNISTVAEDNSSDSDAIVIALPHGLVTSQVLSPSPAAGSSFEPPNQINSQIEVEEGTELHEVQNHSVETNDQPHSISMEFHAIAGSAINTPTKGTCSDSGEIVIAPPQSPIAYEVSTPVAVIQAGMSDSKVHNEIQNLIIDSNNQQHSISMELHDVASSITNNQTEVVSSDSTAAEIYKEPLASRLPDAVGSSFEPVTEHGLDTETEPHVSEAILDIESQQPAEETDIELLPPVLMEIDVTLEVGAETQTEDGNSQAEMEMDVDLSPESGKTKVLKVSVCLTCGDEGFEEAIVYCSKCGDYAMHRYCLAGPVVFTDKVTWFCEDCEEMVVDADHPNCETPESEKDEVVFDPQPIADPVWRGSFRVFNKSFDKISGLMGHLSTLACPKVLEEARHLPDVLYANLLQRSAVWPESFKKFGTNNQSIGLYFFPENERVERYYDQLVDEMISNDLAIRVIVEKTELLIFPSTWLPRQYKRFQSKYYLWGIFKRKQASCTIKDT